MIKKTAILTILLIIVSSCNAYAIAPKVSYILNSPSGFKDGFLIDQSGYGNDGKTDGNFRTDMNWFIGNAKIPVEAFKGCETYTWNGRLLAGGGTTPLLFSIESDYGYIQILGSGGSGMVRMFEYRIEDYINDTYADMMYYDRDSYLDESLHNFTLVHDKDCFTLYIDGKRLEPQSYSYGSDERCKATLDYILSGNNPTITLLQEKRYMPEMQLFDRALTEEEVIDLADPETPIETALPTLEPTATSSKPYNYPYKIISVEVNDGTIKLGIEKSETPPLAQIIFAEYDDGVFKRVQIKNISSNENKNFTKAFTYSGGDYKAFIWDSLGTITALAETREFVK